MSASLALGSIQLLISCQLVASLLLPPPGGKKINHGRRALAPIKSCHALFLQLFFPPKLDVFHPSHLADAGVTLQKPIFVLLQVVTIGLNWNPIRKLRLLFSVHVSVGDLLRLRLSSNKSSFNSQCCTFFNLYNIRFFFKVAQAGGGGGGVNLESFGFRLFSLNCSALEHSATAPPSISGYICLRLR